MRKNSVKGIFVLAFLLTISSLSWKAATNENKISTKPIIAKASVNNNAVRFEQYAESIYTTSGLSGKLNFNVFKKALTGYYNMQPVGNKNILTVIDFSLPSSVKRLWVIDLVNQKVLYNTLVAHGQGSGDNMATRFSNNAESHQSSLGFYITDDIYTGKHGMSLHLNGLDQGINSNARNRSIVVHGADYVSQQFINRHGRLGRSFGCPALPFEFTAAIINTIKGGSCLYINGPDTTYSSKFLDEDFAVNSFVKANTEYLTKI
ncbi:murein L,D-transpeptidase catalytic domain family protein [Pedobacter sp. BS3]|uniref:murein L,D-transpeptidase catalytic domain family protein n=1 Tax=Pedobacter sp. BS3 TaxID=2567937 RepID=UPI0011EDA9BC|nr:murein L,D-transpeptidase catalytic domain family protein [Pedobacter sp. BS3]TZF81158.1 murein L,D-transpeptidase catalytic domain family protein [Pedobacter sp. BS3]